MTRVVFALERCAKTGPPTVAGFHATDQGMCFWNFDGWLDYTDRIADPQPLWWYDLRPPDGEGVTVDDLEETVTALVALSVTLPSGYHRARAQPIFARLRAALDALEADDA